SAARTPRRIRSRKSPPPSSAPTANTLVRGCSWRPYHGVQRNRRVEEISTAFGRSEDKSLARDASARRPGNHCPAHAIENSRWVIRILVREAIARYCRSTEVDDRTIVQNHQWASHCHSVLCRIAQLARCRHRANVDQRVRDVLRVADRPADQLI